MSAEGSPTFGGRCRPEVGGPSPGAPPGRVAVHGLVALAGDGAGLNPGGSSLPAVLQASRRERRAFGPARARLMCSAVL